MFRPGYIQPVHGIISRIRSYRLIYGITGPLYPLLKKIAPNQVITTEERGRAMLAVAQKGADKRILESSDWVAIARANA